MNDDTRTAGLAMALRGLYLARDGVEPANVRFANSTDALAVAEGLLFEIGEALERDGIAPEDLEDDEDDCDEEEPDDEW